MNKFSNAFNIVVIFFILSGGLYFIYYSLQFNKAIYLLIGILIYVISFSIRNFLVKRKNNTGFTEFGMFFISMVFLAYTLYIFKLDKEVAAYLPDKLLINSGIGFIFLFLIHLLSEGKSKKLNIIFILILVVVVKIFYDRLNLISQNFFQIYPWVATLIIGAPYIYLLSLLTGVYKIPAENNPR